MSLVRVRIDSSHCEDLLHGGTWENFVDVPGGLTIEERLDWLFRFFNRVDEADCQRLDTLGYRLPSLTAGDLVTVDGATYRCASVGWEAVPTA